MEDINSKEVIQFGKGLHTDNSPQTQPNGTLRFALNCVDETEEGDMLFPTNMESNIGEGILPSGYAPIGKVYIGDGETVLFLVGPNGESEIGIYNDTYTTILNDKNYTSKLNFKITHQIDAVYRLRRGCDKTLYWTDDINPVRQYIINRGEDYFVDGVFNADLLNLFRKWNKIPEFSDIKVLESGALKAGSYNFAVQYLDSDLNPTEWIITSDTVNIYNDSYRSSFSEIRGSSNLKTEYQNWGESTGKAIKVSLNNLDTNFPFYRIAIIEATNGSGKISKVTASPALPTEINEYIFEDTSSGTIITIEEISQVSNVIHTAKSIEQIENRLLLGNTKNKQFNFCDLQKYASKIISNYIVEEVVLDQIADDSKITYYDTTLHKKITIDEASPKNPLINTKKVGYMPGEVYSFGIVYYFKDGSFSPVYHIPGKSFSDTSGLSNMIPYESSKEVYTDSSNCEDADYWGKDYNGNSLKNQHVRFHKFPTRLEAIKGPLSEPGIGFVNEKVVTTESSIKYAFKFRLHVPVGTTFGAYNEMVKFFWEDGTSTLKIIEFGINPYTATDYTYQIDIRDTDTPPTHYEIYKPENYPSGIEITDEVLPAEQVSYETKKYLHTANILGIVFSNITVPQMEGDNEIIGYRIVRNKRTENDKTVLDSGVLFPISKYEDFLAYGHTIPNLADNLANFTLEDNIYAFLNPEFLFNKREYQCKKFIKNGEFKGVERYDNTGDGIKYYIRDRIIENFVEDAYPGTSYDPAYHSGSSKDTDGLTLHTITKYRETKFENGNNVGSNLIESTSNEIFYLDALSSKSISTEKSNIDVFNISSDNKIGIVKLSDSSYNHFTTNDQNTIYVSKYITKSKVVSSTGSTTVTFTSTNFADIFLQDGSYNMDYQNDFIQLNNKSVDNIPYFYMIADKENPYTGFRYLPYYSEQDNITPISESQSERIFNGDVYISPLTYNNTFFHDIKPFKRKTKDNTWKFILGSVLIVAGIVGGIFTGGASTVLTGIGVGLLGASAGISFLASGLKGDKLSKIYEEKYEEGLKYVTRDTTTKKLFVDPSPTAVEFPADDEIQWYNEVVNGLWFESQVNISLRQGNTIGLPDFINSPFEFSKIIRGTFTETSKHKAESASNEYFRRRAVEKLSVLDPESDGGRLYQGYATSEFYEVNKDFERREKEKPFFHLGLEYNCCLDCLETFPHRVYYSEQSFQEENTDNYRVFLPNNYRDINGETGEITNIFKIQNNLFIHTKEAIWKLPKNYQERITDEIVSFIGTGDYFSIPPQLLIDDETGNSYGTSHKWSRLKTPYGYFFVSENQNAICVFDGNKVENISKLGNYYWFYNHIPILSDTIYKDNPSNPNGAGFITVYDSKKDLVFFTKKDKLPTGENNSWTVSFNLKKKNWGSWHSFMPNFYFQTPQKYFSWISGDNHIWRHNVIGNYQTYYGKLYPFIIEYVLNENPLMNKLFEDITIQLESKKYDPTSKTFYNTDNDFFNKLLAYNSKQCTGILNIVVKDKENTDFFYNQIQNNSLQNIIADRNERNWTVNELRDMIYVKNTPMFSSDIKDLQENYFIDKVLYNNVINFNKDWTQIESFRDKYLVVRFIFDKFADVKLITNFTLNDETVSLR